MPPPSVLVVDDDVGTVDTLADIFREKAYRVATAHSGEAAVAMARQEPYDAVLMDIRMPGLDGVEALREIRASVPDANVIMMTAFTRTEMVDEARREGAVAVLPKPLEIDRVLDLVERAARAKRDPHGGDG